MNKKNEKKKKEKLLSSLGFGFLQTQTLTKAPHLFLLYTCPNVVPNSAVSSMRTSVTSPGQGVLFETEICH
jgi:hypothetical protein